MVPLGFKRLNKKFSYFPYISHLFEVLESTLMEINLSGLTLTSFNLI
jgi:hypothetical protein